MSVKVACEDGVPNAALVRLQDRQKVILAAVQTFCEQHAIPFVLAAGSALGAQRHGDMIPWDDDIDIAMMRSDLKRFETLWLCDYQGDLTLHSPRTERAYPLDYIKIRQPGTAMHEPELAGSGMADGIYIDIFAFDALPRSPAARTFQRAALAAMNIIIMSYSERTTRNSASALIRALRRISLALRKVLPWRALISLRERVASAAGSETGSGREIACFEMYGIGQAPRTAIALEKVFPPRSLLFGKVRSHVPQDNDAYLTGLFGDWQRLPPPAQRQPPHARMVDFGP